MRDVVILGWWADVQNRISFVHLLRRELGLRLGDAKRMLDVSLDAGEPISVTISPSSRAPAVARTIAAMGAEVRLLSGHAGCDLAAAAQLQAIQEALRAFHCDAHPTGAARCAAAARICPELALAEAPEPGERAR